MCFVGVMLIPITYYVFMATWLPRSNLERAQYIVGLAGFVVLGPFINISVMFYAVWNMDSFGWGKTRQVIEDDKAADETDGSASEAQSGSGGSTTLVQRQVECTCGC